MGDDRIKYQGRIEGMPGDLVRQVPSTLKCRSCGEVILKTKKDHKRRHMSLDIISTIPPEIMHDGAMMGLVCHRCGSKTLLQLRTTEHLRSGH